VFNLKNEREKKSVTICKKSEKKKKEWNWKERKEKKIEQQICCPA
jgi:hypothetical protein